MTPEEERKERLKEMCEREKKRDALEIEKIVFEREGEMFIWQKLREREKIKKEKEWERDREQEREYER